MDYRYLWAALFGSVIAYISLNTTIEMVAFSSLIFLAYFFIEKRSYLFFIIFSYHVVASYGILFGISTFYTSGYILGFLSWLFVIIATTLPWILIWSKYMKKRALLFPFVLMVTILPPIGFIEAANPIVSAGLFFPGTGYFGIVLYIATLYLLVFLSSKYMPGFKKWIFNISLISLYTMTGCDIKPLNTSNFITPVQTQYSFSHRNTFIDQKREKDLFKKIKNMRVDTILLPENILGSFSKEHMQLWRKLPHNKTVLAGASIYDSTHKKYDNVLLSINHQGYKVLYVQRIPIPFSMWIPFSDSKANARISSTELVSFQKKQLGILICYEQYLPYIYLETMWKKPDYLIATSNLWWSSSTIISRAQKYYLILWSRLFGIPYFYAVNY